MTTKNGYRRHYSSPPGMVSSELLISGSGVRVPGGAPPSAEEAAKIASAAWAQDPDWGTFAWLTFVTGARRGELVALAWEHLDLVSGPLTIRRNPIRRNGTTILRDTKTHQMRVIRLDQDTITILSQHKARAEQRRTGLGTTLDDDASVSSYAPDHRRHRDPDAITHRYAKMTADPGIDTHPHALRHYSATEPLAGGAGPRTVAGRPGHAGGGATPLTDYAAWLAGAGTKAADLIASRLPRPPQVLDADDAGLNPSRSPAESVTDQRNPSHRL